MESHGSARRFRESYSLPGFGFGYRRLRPQRPAAASPCRCASAPSSSKARDLERKNAELARSAYAIAHDLRNPPVTISVYTGVLQQHIENGEPDRFEDDLERVDEAAAEMRRLLDDLESRLEKSATVSE